MSVEHTLRKLAKQRRDIARPRLQHLLHWVTWYALRPMIGVPLSEVTDAQADHEIRILIRQIADRGVFSYFGIYRALDLGPLPIALRRIDFEGSVALEVEPLADAIMFGGARGAGWLGAGELSISDLSR